MSEIIFAGLDISLFLSTILFIITSLQCWYLNVVESLKFIYPINLTKHMALDVLIVSNSQHHIAAGMTDMVAKQNKHSTTHVHCEQKALEAMAETDYRVILVDEDLETQDAENDAMAVEVARRLRLASPNSFVYVLKRGIDSDEKGPDGINGYFPKNMRFTDDIFSAVEE